MASQRDQARDDAFDELLAATLDCGYPAALAQALAAQLTTEMTMRRMAGYLRAARPSSMEEIADEALAIIAQRDSWVEKKKREYANEKLNEFYNRPRTDE